MSEKAESRPGHDPASGSVPPEVDRPDAAATEAGRQDVAPTEAGRQSVAATESQRDVAATKAGQRDPGATETDRATEADRLGERVAELEDLWRRALAEADNLRKRFARELSRERSAERARVAALLLPVIDDLERALAHAESHPGAIIEGVRSVRDHAVRLLEQLGFPRHDEVGATFDPARHSAVAASTDSNLPPGTIVEVVQPGYGDEDNQLRPALVVVATKAD